MPRSPRAVALLVCLAASLGLAPGCRHVEDNLALTNLPQEPLAFDPTDPLEIGRWWSNGSRMLRLDDDGGYALYGGTNRYHPPVERGSWSRPRFTELRLAPYRSRGTPWDRVSITREGDRLVLNLVDEAPMTEIDGPPMVAEDRVIGEWRSPDVRLVLDSRGRFLYDPDRRGAIAASHPGDWRLAGELIRLVPDVATFPTVELRVETREDGTVRLLAADGAFDRVVESPPPPPPPPA